MDENSNITETHQLTDADLDSIFNSLMQNADWHMESAGIQENRQQGQVVTNDIVAPTDINYSTVPKSPSRPVWNDNQIQQPDLSWCSTSHANDPNFIYHMRRSLQVMAQQQEASTQIIRTIQSWTDEVDTWSKESAKSANGIVHTLDQLQKTMARSEERLQRVEKVIYALQKK